MNRWRPWEFQGNETILSDTVLVGTCHHTLVKTYRTFNRTAGKVNPDVNSELYFSYY